MARRLQSSLPDLVYETDARLAGYQRIAGIDEVGRGPLAGPVTAAAVVLDIDNYPTGLNDSKKLSPKRREELAVKIRQVSDWAIAHVWIEEIDRLNIHYASLTAMHRAITALPVPPEFVLIDGNVLPKELPMPGQAIVKGDSLSLSIAAASILAKTARDQIMVDLAQQFPGYGWEKNAGYPTAEHKRALLTLGITPYHRRSYAPVHNILCKDTIITI